MESTLTLSKFLLVTIVPQKMTDEEALQDLRELKSLVETYGGKVVDLVVQHREVHDKGMYIGRGKVEEVAEVVKTQKIDVVVLNAIVKPSQIHTMKKMIERSNPKVELWDRVDLILQIFSKYANTAEAKLQIEIARMRHMGPRIYGMGFVLSRQGGGIGTSGIGETNTELMRRHWRDQMKKVQDRLQKLSSEREQQLIRRQKMGLPTVSIVGYTNAGKTSLFNVLTGKKNYVKNALFATLDSSVGKLFLPTMKKEILVSDTIGFIRHLPAKLINAFRSTLLESIHADLLLHVIDASDEDMDRKIRTVEDTLWELGLHYRKRIYVFNKIDIGKVNKKALEETFAPYHPQFISVKEEIGISSLIAKMEEYLSTEEMSMPKKSPRMVKQLESE